ncbi:hypothetical protein ANCCEY_00864 [Ancylostoma ceylanicum]|uniref:Uncharacterized protein n=1 Tax=Ancylostoma ceylanicum TaxID=53326 RepID=A0A0D6MB50_9BILA|nr:hypothetical protein ANCCEY_00864 [Ancylostoma ceylanicum]
MNGKGSQENNKEWKCDEVIRWLDSNLAADKDEFEHQQKKFGSVCYLTTKRISFPLGMYPFRDLAESKQGSAVQEFILSSSLFSTGFLGTHAAYMGRGPGKKAKTILSILLTVNSLIELCSYPCSKKMEKPSLLDGTKAPPE